MDIKRILNLKTLLKKKSFFLFGPRQVGKSHIIKSQLKDCSLIINLLDNELSFRLKRDPSYLKALIAHKKKLAKICGD